MGFVSDAEEKLIDQAATSRPVVAESHSPSNSGEAVRAMGKPRVLIVPNSASWIIGQMAAHIIKRFSDRYEFWLLTDKMIRLRPDVARTLVSCVDFIFPLTDKGYQLLRQAAGGTPLPPSLLWVHHVTSWNPSMKEAVNNSVGLIACTATWKEQIERQSPAGVEVTIVPHGVDAEVLKRKPSARAKLGIPEHSFVVGFVGSKTSNYDEGRKGLDVLHTVITAAGERIPNLHISFLGLGWEEEVAALRGQGISANYVGFIPESQLASFYSSIDVYLLTSRIEGGPCTVLEAMACETAVVTTRVGLVPEVIVDGETGFFAEVGDAKTLLAHLIALASSAELRKRIGKAARAKVAASRSWHVTLQNLEQPLADAAALAVRNREQPGSFATSPEAKKFAGAVHTIDGLLWGVVSWWQKLQTAPNAIRMVRSCWEGYGFVDVLRGVGLVTRVSFRPSRLRKLLATKQRMEALSPPRRSADLKPQTLRSE
jgi:glycosyltransferase involved in cell wall biosynthesis